MDLNDFEETHLDDLQEEQPAPEGEPENGNNGGNRPFLVAISVIGGIFILAIIGMIIYLLINQPKSSSELQQQAAEINAQNTAIALIATQTSESYNQQATSKAAPSNTPVKATNTPVVAIATNTPIPAGTSAGALDAPARTATVSAFQTQMAVSGQGTPGGPTPTALPTTGFADEIGLPGLLGAAALLLVIIVFARRLRTSSNNL